MYIIANIIYVYIFFPSLKTWSFICWLAFNEANWLTFALIPTSPKAVYTINTFVTFITENSHSKSSASFLLFNGRSPSMLEPCNTPLQNDVFMSAVDTCLILTFFAGLFSSSTRHGGWRAGIIKNKIMYTWKYERSYIWTEAKDMKTWLNWSTTTNPPARKQNRREKREHTSPRKAKTLEDKRQENNKRRIVAVATHEH